MNEITKKNIQEKLEMTMTRESLKPGQIAKYLDLIPGYISMIRKEAQWEKCPKTAWEKVLSWINSGESLVAYKEKQVEIKKKAETTKATISSLEKTTEELFEAKVAPETETIEADDDKFSSPLKAEKTILIDLLEAERNILNEKLQAINSLLKHYSDND